MGTVSIFIDGGYLDKLARELNMGNINYRALIHEMVEKDNLTGCYYYNCLPYKTKQEPISDYYRNRQKLFTSLAYMPKMVVRTGRLVRCGQDIRGHDIFQQKQVDTSLSLDMYDEASKVERIALIAGDEDYVPAVERLKKLNTQFTLWYGDLNKTRASRLLLNLADTTRAMTPDSMEHCVF